MRITMILAFLGLTIVPAFGALPSLDILPKEKKLPLVYDWPLAGNKNYPQSLLDKKVEDWENIVA